MSREVAVAKSIQQPGHRSGTGALLESQDRFHKIFTCSNDAIFVIDPARDEILDANPTACHLLGYSLEELLRLPVSAIHPSEMPQLMAFAQAVSERGHGWTNELSCLTKNHELLPAEISASVVELGGRPAIIAMVRDVSERKRAEELLQATMTELEQQYRQAKLADGTTRAILDTTTDAMVMVGRAGRVLMANRRFGELFSLPQDRLLGIQFEVLEQALRRALVPHCPLGNVSAALRDHNQSFAKLVTQRSPQRRDLELLTAPVQAGDGDYLGQLYVFRDVTELRQADRLKTEMVALTTHELRSPLTSIKGYVELLMRGNSGPLVGKQQLYVETIHGAVNRLVNLVDQLLDLSHLESGAAELELAPVSLPAIAANVADMFRPQTDAKQQQVVFDFPPSFPQAWADADQLSRILVNLVSNAHKYTPSGGTITISARANGEWLQVAVRDTGVGIAPEHQSSLFSKFFRVHNGDTDRVKGSGLGLAIVRSLVEMHGGEIACESMPGLGSTFSFTLPALSCQTATA